MNFSCSVERDPWSTLPVAIDDTPPIFSFLSSLKMDTVLTTVFSSSSLLRIAETLYPLFRSITTRSSCSHVQPRHCARPGQVKEACHSIEHTHMMSGCECSKNASSRTPKRKCEHSRVHLSTRLTRACLFYFVLASVLAHTLDTCVCFIFALACVLLACVRDTRGVTTSHACHVYSFVNLHLDAAVYGHLLNAKCWGRREERHKKRDRQRTREQDRADACSPDHAPRLRLPHSRIPMPTWTNQFLAPQWMFGIHKCTSLVIGKIVTCVHCYRSKVVLPHSYWTHLISACAAQNYASRL